MRTAVIALMLLISAPAAAEWVKFEEDARTTVYFDPTTMKVNGDLRTVWTHQEFRPLNDWEHKMSSRVLHELDCKEMRHRILSGSLYSEPNAGGKVIESIDSPFGWGPISPNTLVNVLVKPVCAISQTQVAPATEK